MGDGTGTYEMLPCDSYAPRRARGFADARIVAALGARPGTRDLREDVAVIVSELVTNAVDARATVVGVFVEFEQDSVGVFVYDDAQGQPTAAEPALLATRGRGLAIVGSLAEEWGFRQIDSIGKWVWATISLERVTHAAGRSAQTGREA